MFCLREGFQSPDAAQDAHEDAHRRKTIQMCDLRNGFQAERRLERTCEEPHGREALQLYLLPQDLCAPEVATEAHAVSQRSEVFDLR